MKHKIMTHTLLLLSLTALTACPQSKSTDSNNPQVAPQGRVMSQDSSSFCDLNNGTLTCYGVDQNTGRQCATLAKSYNPNDRVNLCSQLYQLRNESAFNSGFSFVQCNVEGALSSAISQHCQGINDMWNQQSDPNNPNNPNPNNPWNPTNPGNPNQPGATVPGYKSFQCDFEAQRTSGRRWTTSISIPRTTALIAFDGRTEQRIDLRTKFLGIDIGRFGTFSMKYKPARGTGGDETIELRNEGLRIGEERVRIVQTGSASQEVKMEALADGLYIKLSCRNSTQQGAPGAGRNRDSGQPTPFSSPVGGANLVCVGETRTVGTDREEVDLVIPLNSISGGQEFEISPAVMGKLSGNSITYNAVLDRDFGPTVVATSSLRSAAAIKTNDRASHIDVTCSIR